MAKQINFNVAGTPTDVPTISNDDPRTVSGVFEAGSVPPKRCIFTLDNDFNGQGYLRFAGQEHRFLLPPAGWHGEAATLGLPPLDYTATTNPNGGLSYRNGKLWTGDQRFIMAGSTDFWLPYRWLSGDEGTVKAVLAQRRAAGANTVRCLAMGWPFITHSGHPDFFPNYWSAIEGFFDFMRAEQWALVWTVFAGTRAQSITGPDEQLAFWRETQKRLARFAGSIATLELCNEWNHGTQNIDPQRFERPAGFISSHGAGLTDEHPVEPIWDMAGIHIRRDTDGGRAFTNADPFEFEAYPYPRPGWSYYVQESAKPENYQWRVDYAHRIGTHARESDIGGIFHSGPGVVSTLWNTLEFSCAHAFYRGVRWQD